MWTNLSPKTLYEDAIDKESREMNSINKILCGIVLAMLLTSIAASEIGIQSAVASLYVHNVNSGLDYATIQEAIDAPETLDGHTLKVDAGTYYEHLTINKSLMLIGGDLLNTIIDGNDSGSNIILGDSPIHEVTVKNLTIQNYENGFHFQTGGTTNQAYGTFENNIFLNNQVGIDGNLDGSFSAQNNSFINNSKANRAYWSHGTLIVENTIINSSFSGVQVIHSNNVLIKDNIFENCSAYTGIELVRSNYIVIDGNEFLRSNILPWMEGFGINITDNTFSLSSVFSEASKILIDGNTFEKGKIELLGNNICISSNTISHAGQGIVLYGCQGENSIIGNNITNNSLEGILIDNSIVSKIIENNIIGNGRASISIISETYYSSDIHSIKNNFIANNSIGIYVGEFSWVDEISENSITNNSGAGIHSDMWSSPVIINGNYVARNGGYGIYAGGPPYGRGVRNNTVVYNGGTGIYTWDGAKILDNYVAHNGGHGIYFTGRHSSIVGNEVFNNTGTGIYLNYVSAAVYKNNVKGNNYGIFLAIPLRPYDPVTAYVSLNSFMNNTNQAYISDTRIPHVWDNGGEGNYWSDYAGTDANNDGIGDVPYVIDANNTDRYPLMLPYKGHNIAVSGVEINRTIIPKGVIQKIDVDITNTGSFPQSFTVSVYANTTATQTFAANLTAGNSTTLTFYWDTANFPYGNYTITANASQTLGETNTQDNTHTISQIFISILGDINGPNGWPDGKVDIRDIALVASKFGVTYPDPRYDPNCDITGPIIGVADGKIDIRDVGLVALHFGEEF